MLDTDTKRRIDTCRDILVGKVPDPKSQVEQITIALIYKFMDDMDAEAEELGGARSFFAGNYAKYGWAKLMAPNMGGFDVLALYSEAIGKMNENPGIPALFRDIFKNAYLPYRDPETLRSFLKEIDGFTYDHSERLGDAFEYLLSVLGSQGDAGQFRTPRHIIDFMVEVIAPKKSESVLDPACGTAGFLISAWKHILKQNTQERPGDQLTPEERANLIANIRGYDISPDMVRLSLVNLYLHGFTDPHIVEYDTLTSEERWNETADIILANPPFMSPKGGIKPHKRFSVQARRSEVLFVDYIAEHLSPQGRAAIVVPEGIIFQSGTAYKQLREMLVKTSLVAVVSLPAGVFNPYSGVKTSILILDKQLAKTCDSVLFVRVENDGFSLGAQRRVVAGSNLAEASSVLQEWMHGQFDEKSALATRVERARIGENGEWNLSGERYIEAEARMTDFPLIELGEIAEVLNGYAFKSENYVADGIRVIRITNVQKGRIIDDNPKFYPCESNEQIDRYLLNEGDLLISLTGNVGRVGRIQRELLPAGLNQRVACIRPKSPLSNEAFLFHILNTDAFEADCIASASGIAQKNLSTVWLAKYKIPVPPLTIQQEIVAEIESYQKIIDGAQQVVESYRPKINVQPEWPRRNLGSLAENLDSRRVPITKGDRKDGPFPYYGASGIVDSVADFIFDEGILLISEDGANLLARSTPIAFSVSGKCWVNNHAHVLKFSEPATQKFVEVYLNSISIEEFVTGAAQPKLNQQAMNGIPIPIPDDVAVQQAIVAEIEAEQALVNANKQLIERFEAKIKAAINRVWGSAE